MHLRIAPTPSGRLHKGNIFNFVLTWWYAKHHGGQLSLRIDDMDEERTKDEWLEDIFRTLEWLCIDFDHGPSSVFEIKNQYSQQLKKEMYFSRLAKKGSLPCARSRKELKDKGPCTGDCLDCQNIEFIRGKHMLRFNVGPDFPVAWRREDVPSYHLASLIDDEQLGITHLIRGADLYESTKQQRLIAGKLGIEFPTRAFHHELLTDAQGEKLSKTNGSLGIRDVYTHPGDIFRELSRLFHIEPFDHITNLLDNDFPYHLLK